MSELGVGAALLQTIEHTLLPEPDGPGAGALDAPSPRLSLHHETLRFVERLHRIKLTAHGLDDYAALRDRLLGQTSRIATHITILADVLDDLAATSGWRDERLGQAAAAAADPQWAEFGAVVKAVKTMEQNGQQHERPADRSKNERQRVRDFATTAALWSPTLLFHYSWDTIGHVHMSLVRRCARACPDFVDDFLPLANTVLVARQRASLKNSRVRSIAESQLVRAEAQPSKRGSSADAACTLTYQDFENAVNLAEKGEVTMYGTQFSRSSVDSEDLKLWCSSDDGKIPVSEDRTLRTLRPSHYEQYLLQPDNYGLFRNRGVADVITTKSRTTTLAIKGSISSQATAQGRVRKSGRKKPANGSSTKSISKSIATAEETPEDSTEGPPKALSEVPEGVVAHSSAEVPADVLPDSPTHHQVASGPSRAAQASPSIEDVLHNRYHKEIQEYAAELEDESGQSDLHHVRASWLTKDTPWASVWTPAGSELGYGLAATEESADVHYYSANAFVQMAERGQVFTKPIVIKEAFSDSCMHTVEDFRALIDDAFYSKPLDVRGLGNAKTESVPGHEFLDRLDKGVGMNALNFHDLVKAHRPTFARLQRFRLLETLTESTRPHPGKDTSSRPIDVADCVSFNILGQRGAFSGAHVDALAGTWVRNLDGLKFWMIVPECDMKDEWENFCLQGDGWLPQGKERLIVLERDDVLLMPPGLRQVHAVHSPQTSLMSGGAVWDEVNIIPILGSLLWIGQNQQATNEALAYQLPDILGALEDLVGRRRSRFDSQCAPETFDQMFSEAIQRLKDLGCRCTPRCTKSCSCRAANRRCTVHYAEHPALPPSAKFQCMHEQFDDVSAKAKGAPKRKKRRRA